MPQEREKRVDFIKRTMPLPTELQIRCPAIMPGHDTYCYLRDNTCNCQDFRECDDYTQIIKPALERKRYK